MRNLGTGQRQGFRVWIAQYQNWQPKHWSDVPPEATAIKPIDGECISAEGAADLLEGFNRVMLEKPRRVWAVAVPVVVRYDHDLEPGETVTDRAIQLATNGKS